MYRLDAPGGCGKTFLSNLILSLIRKEQKIAIATAMSGIASILLTLGTTFHKRFGVPIPTFKDSCSKILLNSDEAKIIKEAKIIIIDEVSMMNHLLLDLLDIFLKELLNNNITMGGKLVLLMHDFRQILPVVPHGSRADIISASVLNASCLNDFKLLRLTRI